MSNFADHQDSQFNQDRYERYGGEQQSYNYSRMNDDGYDWIDQTQRDQYHDRRNANDHGRDRYGANDFDNNTVSDSMYQLANEIERGYQKGRGYSNQEQRQRQQNEQPYYVTNQNYRDHSRETYGSLGRSQDGEG